MPRRLREEERAEEVFTVKHDASVEQVVLAAALVDRTLRTKLVKLVPHHDKLHTPQLSAAWAAVLEMERRNLDYDPALMTRLVGDRVDTEYLAKVLDERPSPPADIDHFVKLLLWDDVRVRAARGPVSLLLEAIADPSCPPERLRAIARQLSTSFEGGAGAGRYLVDGEELVRTQMADVDARIAGRSSFPFGLPGLDYYEDGYCDRRGEDIGGAARMTPGAMPKLITLIAADTGVGKSLLAAQMAIGQARKRKRVLYCAWEPEEGMTLELMAAITLGWSRTSLITGRSQDDRREPMTPGQRAVLEERMHAIQRYVTFMSNPFFNSVKPSNNAHLDVLQEHVESSGADFVVCDLWERLLVENRPDQEAAALKRQQSMAKQTRAHFLLLAQFNKSEASQGKPNRRSIAGTGAWAQVPNNILCPYRPALYKNVEDDTIEIHVLKQRDGLYPQAVEFGWDGDRGAILGGKTLEYEPPGAGEENSVGEMFGRKKKTRKERD